MHATNSYDVIVVGARCAGSPTAMLLGRLGYRVLLVDRATFPSDTISTHIIHPPGVRMLARWGLLERVVASGCPAVNTYAFDMGAFAISGNPGTEDAPVAYCPRRTVLDALLVNAAAEAGVEVRQGFVVEEIIREDGRVSGIRGHDKDGPALTEHARVVVGADGLYSLVARAVSPEHYHERPPLQVSYYTYWSGLPMNGRFEGYDRGDRAFAACETNDGLTLVIVGWPFAEFEANKGDIETHYLRAIERAPSLALRVRAARREDRFVGTSVPNFFRKPFGPGWALVGDAAYNKDFITAQGITDAFRSAELCVQALHETLSGARPFDEAMAAYQATRDTQARPMYDFTCQFASMTPPPPEMLQLFDAIHRTQPAMDGFVQVFAGVRSPADYFSQENVSKIFAAAASA